jgi:hypothetical protein
VAGELADTALEHADDGLGEGGLVEVDDVLDDVVAEGILDEDAGLLRDALDEPELLVTGRMINAALEDTAAMAMRAHVDAVATNGVKDELRLGGGELVEAFLDNMVTVEVLDEIDHTTTQGLSDEVDLLGSVDVFNHLLEGTGAMGVESDANHVLGRVLDENGPVVVIAELEKLLAQIIAKRIRHELDDVLVRLEPDHMDLLVVALLKLLLEVTAAVLVLAKIVHLATER